MKTKQNTQKNAAAGGGRRCFARRVNISLLPSIILLLIMIRCVLSFVCLAFHPHPPCRSTFVKLFGRSKSPSKIRVVRCDLLWGRSTLALRRTIEPAAEREKVFEMGGQHRRKEESKPPSVLIPEQRGQTSCPAHAITLSSGALFCRPDGASQCARRARPSCRLPLRRPASHPIHQKCSREQLKKKPCFIYIFVAFSCHK